MSGQPPQALTFEEPDLGNRSYVIHDGRVAVVIDPQREIGPVLKAVKERHLEISHVLETHIHNDYVSGGWELADITGARYVLSGHEAVEEHRARIPIRGGDIIETGSLAVEAVHTPGHTPHHLSYIVRATGSGQAWLFSGGSLLFGATGRTDLFGPDAAPHLAQAQWRSARTLLAAAGADGHLLPTHGFGSFCSAGAGVQRASGDLRDELHDNPVFMSDEATFTERLGVPRSFPRYYVHMGPLNRRSSSPLYPPLVTNVEPAELPALSTTGIVLDVRLRRSFAAQHVPGSLNVEWSPNFAGYAGWIIPWGAPIALISDRHDVADLAVRALGRIGVEHVAVAVVGRPTEEFCGRYPVATFSDLAAALAEGERPLVIDAREREEWQSGHVGDASSLPFHSTEAGAAGLPIERDPWVHCAKGYRAAIAASILARLGHRPTLIDDEFSGAVRAGLSVGGTGQPVPAVRDTEHPSGRIYYQVSKI